MLLFYEYFLHNTSILGRYLNQDDTLMALQLQATFSFDNNLVENTSVYTVHRNLCRCAGINVDGVVVSIHGDTFVCFCLFDGIIIVCIDISSGCIDDVSRVGIDEAEAAGHQIAFHSASHEYSDIYRSPDAYWQDLALLKERIAPYVHTEGIRYLRFPGGSTNTVSRRYGGKGLMSELKAQAAEKGFTSVDWNVCAEDAVGGKPSASTIYRNVVRETGEQTQCIVLMHDSATTHTTAEALPDIIQWYRDQGFTFCRVEQVLPTP